MREFADHILLIFIPYIVITRCLSDLDSCIKFIKYIFYVCIILSVLGLVTVFLEWEFYLIFRNSYYAFRDTGLRIDLTIGTASLATLMCAGTIILEYFKSNHNLPSSRIIAKNTFHLWVIRALFFGIVLATGNRGGLIQYFISILVFYTLVMFGKSARQFLLFMMLIGFIAVITYLPQFDWSTVDEHGTFEYRYNIALASIVQFNEAPLFGRMDFLDSGNFDHLVQGQGIIDIVNVYLQIVLEFGAIGLLLFLGIYFGTLISTYKKLNLTSRYSNERYLLACIIAILFPYLIVIATTSNVAFMPLLGIILMSLGNAIVSSVGKQKM